jgi:hypothetical protein
MNRIYLLSTGYIPVQMEKWKKVIVVQRIVGLSEARRLLENGFISAVGHQSTAEIISAVLGIYVPYNRQSVYLEPSDEAVCFILKTRPPEGRVLSIEEIEQIGYYFIHARVLSGELMNKLTAQGIA